MSDTTPVLVVKTTPEPIIEDVQQSLWVFEINHTNDDGATFGYTSLHATQEGARKRRQKIVKDWGLEALDALDQVDATISYLPVED